MPSRQKKPTGRQGKGTKSLPVTNPNAAGIDIGATSIYVAIPPERCVNNVRSFGHFTRDINALVLWLLQHGITTVAMESTGVYWVPVYQALEDAGIEVCLVNAAHVKNVPGRKSDVSDCQWLQFLHSVGLLRGSFRPEQEICAVRSILRHKKNLVALATTHTHHMQKSLDQMNIQLHHVINDITGLTGLKIVDAILEGERDPVVLAQLRSSRIKATASTIVKALEGDYRPEHLFTLRQSLESYRHIEKLILECDREISRMIHKFNNQELPVTEPSTQKGKESILQCALNSAFGVDLTKVTGLAVETVQVLFAEIGPDLSKFRTASAFASWLCLSPNNEVTGGKTQRSRTRKSVSRPRNALRMAASNLLGSKSYLGDFYRRLRARYGAPKAITIAAHKLARIIYALVTTKTEFSEEYIRQKSKTVDEARTRARLQAKATSLGLKLVPA